MCSHRRHLHLSSISQLRIRWSMNFYCNDTHGYEHCPSWFRTGSVHQNGMFYLCNNIFQIRIRYTMNYDCNDMHGHQVGGVRDTGDQVNLHAQQ